MTTLVYCDGELASDSQTSEGHYVSNNIKKVYKVGDDLLGFCGDTASFEPLLNWYKSGQSDELLKEIGTQLSFTCFVIPKRGTKAYKYSSDLGKFREEFPKSSFAAEGSGAIIALGALEAGATAAEAVKAAIKRDIYSGGRIQVVCL